MFRRIFKRSSGEQLISNELMKEKKSIKFFLPESKDLVDPEYDFLADSYGVNRLGSSSDIYAHQIFSTPNFDGMLVTKSIITPKIEESIVSSGGIHKFLHLSDFYPIMGDCGAFQYINEKEPIYTCQEICEYYDLLGFDYGITLDHLILEFNETYDGVGTMLPPEPTEDMKFRYRISLDNAKTIINIVKEQGLKFKPIGSVQGWSPQTYHTGVKELIEAGFDYIALGGLARADNSTIIKVLDEVRETVINQNVGLHVLGVARLNILAEYIRSNVISCDSSSTIFQAFKSNKDNYHMPDKKYTAVRIPPGGKDASPKIRKLLNPYKEKNDLIGLKKEEARLHKLEQAALGAVRAYSSGKIDLTECMESLTLYENEFGGETKYYPLFEETLRDKPWEKCDCDICKSLGVEVVLLRGNNRNRRRGFHNTYVFYKQFKEFLSDYNKVIL